MDDYSNQEPSEADSPGKFISTCILFQIVLNNFVCLFILDSGGGSGSLPKRSDLTFDTSLFTVTNIISLHLLLFLLNSFLYQC